jgi:hypothetical protein
MARDHFRDFSRLILRALFQTYKTGRKGERLWKNFEPGIGPQLRLTFCSGGWTGERRVDNRHVPFSLAVNASRRCHHQLVVIISLSGAGAWNSTMLEVDRNESRYASMVILISIGKFG